MQDAPYHALIDQRSLMIVGSEQQFLHSWGQFRRACDPADRPLMGKIEVQPTKARAVIAILDGVRRSPAKFQRPDQARACDRKRGGQIFWQIKVVDRGMPLK